ncbi:MAG: SPOR domain-containing protein [Proteobacteria bacterium]|nr:SPOR domain-containing protein [Pseudomonadota bacterium]
MLDRTSPRVIRRPVALGLVAALLLPAAAAFGQDAVSYPASRSLNDIGAWLLRDTPIQLGQVVDVGPSAVTAVTSASPMGQPRGFLAGISSEAVDPQIVAHEGVASWSIPVEVDCDRRMVRLGAMTGFNGRDLKSDGRHVRDADANWVTPLTNAPLGAVIRGLCDRDYKRPFAGRKIAAAKPLPVPPPAKVAEAAPAPPALRTTLPPKAPKPASEPRTPAASKTIAAATEAPKGGGSVAVQIGASPSKADIEALLARFRKAHAEDLGGLATEVATVQSEGKTVNRALIKGFASSVEAGAFCKKLEASGQACFIRR